MAQLNQTVYEFLQYRFNLYRIGWSDEGEIIDTITPGLLKEGFVRLIMTEDYTWHCERLRVKPDKSAVKHCLDYIFKTCYANAKRITNDEEWAKLQAYGNKGDGNITACNLEYPKVFVCD